MPPVKRKMPPASLLQRRVKPRYEPEPESDVEDDLSEAPSEEDAGSLGSGDEEDAELSEDGSGSSDGENPDAGSDEDEDEDDTPHIDASQLSFGALAKAQAAMQASSKRKRAGTDHDSEADVQDGLARERPRDTAKKPEKRTSKHAPAEMTSKKQVSRRRDFLATTAETKKVQARDPRFMPLGPGAFGATAAGGGSKLDEIKARKAYAFLDDYRESEMQELRTAIKKTKNPVEKEKLQKALMSMESRKKTQDRKDKERAVIEEHRKKEKELVKQGKTPFYLKKSEQKKRMLVDQFQGMKKKEADRAIERRRKKVAGKEKKLLPMARRGAEDR